MQRNLFTYIWRHSRPEQVVILSLVVLAQVFYFLSLTVPKSVINNGIQGNAFKDSKTIPFLVWELDLSAILPGKVIRIFDGFQVDQLGYLVTMSFVFLGAVVVNGLFKKTINTQKGRMGERMLRRLRYELYDRILRFPPAHFRKVKQAELATMIKDEVEPLGGFIGDAFVQPMFLGGQALTAILFIMLQNWLLGIIVVVLLGVQMAIIPRLRRPVLILGRQRQITARQLAGRIAETADGVHEIHIHGAANYERADISERLGRIFKIRFDLYQKKFVAKFWNNILSQATPFAIYLVGGYFAITGQMDVGAVVGVLLAYKDLPSPIKELLDWDQQRQDVQIKYEQVIDQFQPEGMMPEQLQAIPDGPPPPLGRELALASVTVSEDGRVKQLDSVSMVLPTCSKLAVIGGSSSGKDVLGPGAGAAHLAERRLDQARRQRFLPAARIRAGLTHLVCRAGDLSLPAVGARQPAVRPEASGRSRRPSTTTRPWRNASCSARRPSAPAIRRSIPTPTGSTTSSPAPPARPICCRAWSKR